MRVVSVVHVTHLMCHPLLTLVRYQISHACLNLFRCVPLHQAFFCQCQCYGPVSVPVVLARCDGMHYMARVLEGLLGMSTWLHQVNGVCSCSSASSLIPVLNAGVLVAIACTSECNTVGGQPWSVMSCSGNGCLMLSTIYEYHIDGIVNAAASP